MSRFITVSAAMAAVVSTWASADSLMPANSIAAGITITTSSGSVLATGDSLTSAQELALVSILADLDACTGGGQNYTGIYNNFVSNGGELGILTGGPAHKKGYNGVTAPDASAILIRVDDPGLNPSKVRARVGHELIHAKYGGSLNDCGHASNWALTFKVLACLCYMGKKTDCDSLDNARDQYDKHAQACTSSGGNPGPPPNSTNPPCCTP